MRIFFNNSSKVAFWFVINDFFVIISLSSSNFGNIFFIFDIITEGLKAAPSLFEDVYDKYSFFSAVVNALYILNWSSYKLSSVPFAISKLFCFNISLSLSFKKPSFLFTLGNIPSLIPIINTIFILYRNNWW